MKRNWIILGGILILLTIAAFIVLQQPGEQSSSTSAGEPLFTYDSAAVDKIELLATSGSVTLEKIGGQWKVTTPLSYPADVNAVAAAVGKGKELKVMSLVSTNPAKQTTFSVDSSATLVRISANNTEVAAFRVGKPSNSWTETYVRKEGSNDVHSVEGLLTMTFVKQPTDWRDKTIFKTDQALLSNVTFQFGDTTFMLTKKDSAAWVIGGETTNSTTVTSFLSALANFQADEFVDTAITAMPKLSTTIAAAGSQLRFYKRPDGKYYVQSSSSSQWFAIQEWKATQLLKRQKDFLAAS
ncbi:MAG: DUF4340 domain-containing protein [Ignavibacteriae bacterium]|nr:DUF4340 domain-containing protein [Ignavibacteriota bacterium]